MRKRTPDELRDISERVYKDLLGEVDTKRMLAKDAEKNPADNGKALRGRARFYDSQVAATLRAIGMDEVED